jgi:predicted CopG family antitoxin
VRIVIASDRMRTIRSVQIDEDIFEFLQNKAQPGESMSDVLRRELQLRTVEIDDDLFAYLLSRTLEIGESASDILRRELHIAPNDGRDGTVVSFHIAAGTDAHAWNSPDDPVTASVGDTLRIFNDDSVPHRLHTDGVPFTHPASDIQPGTSVDYVLTAPFSSAAGHTLYDHDHGVEAAFWLTVLAKA